MVDFHLAIFISLYEHRKFNVTHFGKKSIGLRLGGIDNEMFYKLTKKSGQAVMRGRPPPPLVVVYLFLELLFNILL